MKAMPERIREVYQPLWQKVSVLHLNWTLYHQFYGASAERIDLLNEFAPVFFRAVQDSMLDGTFLAISRLMDPPRSAGKDNLVLERLVLAVEADEAGLASRLGLPEKLREARDQCAVFRRIRNKRLAHNDLKAALGQRAEDSGPMGASRQHVEEALKSIRGFMNAVQDRYLGGETLYDHVILGPGDGESLIHHLGDLRKRREEDPRRRRG